MNRLTCALSLALALGGVTPSLCQTASSAETTKSPIVVDLNPAAPGQDVILRWYFTGDRVLLSGGRFKKTPVTGRTWISDRPKQTTRYTFDLEFTDKSPDPATGQPKNKKVKAQYSIVVQIAPMPAMEPYRAKRGWSVWHLKPWKPEPVSSPAYGRDYLVFFQQGDDALERLSVAVVPSNRLTSEEMVSKIRSDAMSRYEGVELDSQQETTHFEVPAVMVVVSGKDPNHGRTKSVVLAFVREGNAYFVSARTSATLFPKRRAVMENMVRSLALPQSGVPLTMANR